MKATNIGKTIVVWKNLTGEEAKKLVDALKKIILVYRNCPKDTFFKVIPIQLVDKNNFVSIIKKRNEVLISMNKNNDKFTYSAIINGDELYKSIGILENLEQLIKNRIRIAEKFSNSKMD